MAVTLGYRLRQISCKGNNFFRQQACLSRKLSSSILIPLSYGFHPPALFPSAAFELSPSTVHSISSIYFFLFLFMIDSKKEESYAVYYRLWIVWKGFRPDIWPFQTFSLSTSFPRFYPQAEQGRILGGIGLGSVVCLIHPHPVDKWMGMEKSRESDLHFCGNRHGQAVYTAVNSWIGGWGLSGLVPKGCPQSFPRLINTL